MVALPMSGYKKSLPDHSINQNTNIKDIKDLYLKITTQQTPQKISCAKPHKEKNIYISGMGSGSPVKTTKFAISCMPIFSKSIWMIDLQVIRQTKAIKNHKEILLPRYTLSAGEGSKLKLNTFIDSMLLV